MSSIFLFLRIYKSKIFWLIFVYLFMSFNVWFETILRYNLQTIFATANASYTKSILPNWDMILVANFFGRLSMAKELIRKCIVIAPVLRDLEQPLNKLDMNNKIFSTFKMSRTWSIILANFLRVVESLPRLTLCLLKSSSRLNKTLKIRLFWINLLYKIDAFRRQTVKAC